LRETNQPNRIGKRLKEEAENTVSLNKVDHEKHCYEDQTRFDERHCPFLDCCSCFSNGKQEIEEAKGRTSVLKENIREGEDGD